MTQQLQSLLASLRKLGMRKLAALGFAGILTAALVGFGGVYLSRPAFETLYAGLDRQDVANIGSALGEAGIAFDVAADGASVKVRTAETARARMLLAEKGLPHSANSGYELYDKLGSLGLTSFMQDVTRVRATEGELARTIQLMNGIRAARVHIVLPDEGSFRRARQPPSASVMIRTDAIADARTGQAIRHLVAAAVPGMSVDQVTVLNTDGTLLSSNGDAGEAAPGKMLGLEKVVAKDIGDNIRRELAPYLGLHNFQVSVTAKLNTDNRQTAETTYNPDGRVERSTRVVKENQTTQNATNQAPTSVTSALPAEKGKAEGDARSSSNDSNKREELTNYELSSKVVTTVSGGYGVDHLSIAVLVNRAALSPGSGAGALDTKLADIESLVASAAGLRKERGDSIKVLAEDFADGGHALDPVPAPTVVEVLMRQSGTAINALTVIVVVVLVLLFAIRPLTRALARPEPEITALATMAEVPALSGPAQTGLGQNGLGQNGLERAEGGALPALDGRIEPSLIADVTAKPRRSPQRRLEQIVAFDEDHAAAILKQWMQRGSAA